MKTDQSFGTVPLRYEEHKWYVFLIQHVNGGHWGFPKGHKEKEEDPRAAAYRELQEETHLHVARSLSIDPFIESYSFQKDGEKVVKVVSYFPVLAEGVYSLQKEEIQNGKWFRIDDALQTITFEESKRVLREVVKYVLEEKT